MKRERSTSKLAHVRTSSVEFARAMLQSARDEFALVHKRLRGFAVANAATAVPPHAIHHHHSHSSSHGLSHRRQGSSVKTTMSAAFANPAEASPPASASSSQTSVAHISSNSSSNLYQQQQPQPQPQPTATIAPPQLAAAQLQFYGFYSTTAFDRSTISPAEAVILAAEMAADIFSEASMLYDMLSEIKVPTDEVRAVDELMARMQSLLNDDDARLPKAPADVTQAQASNVRNVYNGLVRVYIFLFQRYHREFVELEVSELLAASWQRLLAFAAEYRVLEEGFILQVNDYVGKLVGAFKC